MRYATYSRLMARPLLPTEYIQPAFNNFRDSLPNDVDERVTALMVCCCWRLLEFKINFVIIELYRQKFPVWDSLSVTLWLRMSSW